MNHVSNLSKSILFDCSKLTKPYRLKRCTYQMMHLCMAADNLGYKSYFRTNLDHYNNHKFIELLGNKLIYDHIDTDVYVAKSDTYYKDYNFEQISSLSAFKVCLCNSDRCFRESDNSDKGVNNGTSVLDRCNLYMPVNHTNRHFNNMIPACHPIDPRFVKLLIKNGLYSAYFSDDIIKIRNYFKVVEDKMAGFMGSPHPNRYKLRNKFPNWVDFNWVNKASSSDYVKWTMNRRGIIDFRGYGDKSLRFTESALLGKTIITTDRISKYYPPIVNMDNVIMFDDWDKVVLEFDARDWVDISRSATESYINGWSICSQIQTIMNYV